MDEPWTASDFFDDILRLQVRRQGEPPAAAGCRPVTDPHAGADPFEAIHDSTSRGLGLDLVEVAPDTVEHRVAAIESKLGGARTTGGTDARHGD